MSEGRLSLPVSIDARFPAHVLMLVYLVLAIANSLVMTSVPRRLLVGVGLLLLIYEAIAFRSHKYEQYFLYLTGAWVATALTLNGVLFGEWVQESVYLPGNIGMALALVRGHLGRRAALTLFYAAAFYFLYRLVTITSPGAMHKILVTGSANGISGILIILCGLYYAIARQHQRVLGLAPAMMCLLVSALALGRSGMAAAAVLLAGLVVYDLALEQRLWLRNTKILVFGTVAVIGIVFVLPKYELVTIVFERFSEYGVSSEGRGRIWGAYGESLDGIASVVGHSREALFGGYTNVHSSYLLWHKSMGLMAIPLYLVAVLALGRALLRDWVLFVLLGSLLLRAFFDELVLPFRLYDFFFLYLVCTALVTIPSKARRLQPVARPVEV